LFWRTGHGTLSLRAASVTTKTRSIDRYSCFTSTLCAQRANCRGNYQYRSLFLTSFYGMAFAKTVHTHRGPLRPSYGGWISQVEIRGYAAPRGSVVFQRVLVELPTQWRYPSPLPLTLAGGRPGAEAGRAVLAVATSSTRPIQQQRNSEWAKRSEGPLSRSKLAPVAYDPPSRRFDCLPVVVADDEAGSGLLDGGLRKRRLGIRASTLGAGCLMRRPHDRYIQRQVHPAVVP
jgi:hypothetical protein